MIRVAEPRLEGNELRYVTECVSNGELSMNSGRFVREFEEAFAKRVGVKHALSCMNGTAALHLALLAKNLKPGAEVLVPTFTYIATANAVKYCGAKPVLVDVDPLTWCIDVNDARDKITENTVGILPVHLYGRVADMEAINALAADRGLWVVEDAAEAQGALGVGVGNTATFSFFANKIMTTGEGGMITTDDDFVAKLVRLYRGQGVSSAGSYDHELVGYNYRMTNLQAAVGLAQLEKFEDLQNRRHKVVEQYVDRLQSHRPVMPITLQEGLEKFGHANWMFTVVLIAGRNRGTVANHLRDAGIETRPAFTCLHHQRDYRCSGSFPIAEVISRQGLTLPTHTKLSEDDIDYICDTLKEALS